MISSVSIPTICKSPLRPVTNFMSSNSFEGLGNELGIIPFTKQRTCDKENGYDKN